MTIKIQSKLIRNLSTEEYNQCSTLTMGDGGCMQYDLRTAFNRPHCKSSVVMAKQKDGTLVAWALIDRIAPNPHVQIYTHPDHRRKGLGTRIMRQVKRILGNAFHYSPWDQRSKAFFMAQDIQVPSYSRWHKDAPAIPVI